MNIPYENNGYEMENTFRDYMKVLFRRKGVVLLTVLTVGVVAFVGLKWKTRVYEARVKMLISAEKQVEAPYYRELIGARNVEVSLTQSEIVKSNPVIERVVRALQLHKLPLDYEKTFASALKARWIDYSVAKTKEKLDLYKPEQVEALLFRQKVEELKKKIKVEPVRDTNMFVIKVEDFSPVGATIIANVISRSYVIFDQEQQLAELQLRYGYKHPTVNLIKDNIYMMSQSLNGAPISNLEAIGPASVKIIEQATVPLESVGPPEILTFILAMIMSVFLGVMLAFTFEYMDQSLNHPQEIERYLGVPYLGHIPKKKLFESRLIHDQSRRSDYVNALQTLTDQVYLFIKDKGLTSILLTPVMPSENTARIVMNLGVNLASKLKAKVLLIDANIRKPSLHREAVSKGKQGLVDVLTEKTTFEEVGETINPNLDILHAGRTKLNPVTLLDSAQMKAFLKQVKNQYALIIVNSPALRTSRDAVILASLLDGVIVAFDEGRSRRQVIKSAINRLAQINEKLLGVVLNNRHYPIPGLIYDRI